MAQDARSSDLAEALSLADELLAIVRRDAPAVTHSRDRNDQFLWVGISRAFRCLRSIRDVVERHQEADDAFILTRALASITLRSLWMASPSDDEERIRRGRLILRDFLGATATQARELEALGMPQPISSETWARRAAEVDVEGGLPTDVALARELGLEDVYATAYRTASGSVHYSLDSALEGFDLGEADATNEPVELSGLRIRFEDGQPERAANALVHACLIFATLLQRSDNILGNTFSELVIRLFEDRYPDVMGDIG